MLRKLRSRLFKKGQVGQSIVILALGFVGILAVVGITTDVSILFARYAQLRRAVDAASIAAAGQMREDRSLADVDLTARQFVELHGLNPRRVWVETCANAPIFDDEPTNPGLQPPGGATLEELDPQICTGDQRKMVRVTAEIESETVFLQFVGWRTVLLQASAISETAVLDVVVIMGVSESMLNETTYADWGYVNQGIAFRPPIIDFGESRIKASPTDTSAENTVLYRMSDLALAGGIPTISFADGRTFIDFLNQPPVINGVQPQVWWDDWFWQEFHLNFPQQHVNNRVWYPQVDGALSSTWADVLASVANPLSTQSLSFYRAPSFIPDDVEALAATGAIDLAAQVAPRPECRVRFYPYSITLAIPPYLLGLYDSEYPSGHQDRWPRISGGNPAKFGGFVPSYGYFGCCNDPGNGTVDDSGNITPGTSVNPDGKFDDLICQPFKQARDATRQFLNRVDFLRGDRVAFVTFDRTASIVDPDGDLGERSHMIEDKETAINVLNTHIGVRAEPNAYIWNENGGGWIDDFGNPAFSAGIDPNTRQPIPIDFASVQPGQLEGNLYQVPGSCLFQNASMIWPFSRYATRNVSGLDNEAAIRNIMTPDIYNPPWSNYPLRPIWTPGTNAYELWSQCRATNIGAALREASNALTDPETSRREGTVWIMIMLSDGAAGASDPARNHGNIIPAPNPYEPHPNMIAANGGAGYDYTTNTIRLYGQRGGYGYFGLCPYGGPNVFPGGEPMGELMLTDQPVNEPVFPFCSDESPITRHFCMPTIRALLGGDSSVGGTGPGPDDGLFEAGFGPGARSRAYDYSQSQAFNQAAGNIYDIDIGNYGAEANCHVLYDVDDYARDWADFVAGIHLDAGDEAVLPTIFTIGFGLNFEAGGSDPQDICQRNLQDCLGEELLRYIADVGDNFQLDTDYQQDWLYDGMLNGIAGPAGDPSQPGGDFANRAIDFGSPDPCEPPGGGYDYMNEPGNIGAIQIFDPGKSCGNYYNAPGQAELQQVFDTIASRMFTRLAG